MQITVCYLAPGIQDCIVLDASEGCTLADAIRASGLPERHPEIDFASQKTGIWNKVVSLQTVLREHDRVEIYRPLTADPKLVRRQRVAAGRTMGGGA